MRSNFSKITSIADPITYIGLDNLKIHLGIYDDNSEDAYLSSLVMSSVELVSDMISYDLGLTHRSEFFSNFDSSMELVRSHTADLTVSYYNSDNELTLVDSTLFVVDATSGTHVVKLLKDSEYPTDLSAEVDNSVVISYTSLTPSDEAPETLIQAVYMLCKEMYTNRGETSDKKQHMNAIAADRLLSRFRKVVF